MGAKLAITLTVVMFIQLVLSIYQIRYYQSFLTELADRYRNKAYFMVTEIVKKRFKSTTVVVIHDADQVIAEAHYLSGITIFSRFKTYPNLEGKKITSELLALEQDKARRSALEKIIKRCMKE